MNKVTFSYDLDFILETLVPAFVETELKGNKEDFTVVVNNHRYLKTALLTKYTYELTQGILLNKIKNLLNEKYPDGCELTEEIFQELAKDYINLLIENETQVLGSGKEVNSYVESASLNTRIYCKSSNHYDSVLILVAMFYGIEDLIKNKYNYEDITNFIEQDIEIHSTYTSKQKIIEDIIRGMSYGIEPSVIFQRIRHEYYFCDGGLMENWI